MESIDNGVLRISNKKQSVHLTSRLSCRLVWSKHYYDIKTLLRETTSRHTNPVVEPGKVAWKKIRQEFGEEVFHPSGELNREALGDIIFDDPKKRRKLNEITHPEIYKELLWAAVRCFFQGHQFIVMDLPLLFESGAMLDYIHKIIVVTCEEDIQLMRLIERGNLTETRAKKRIASQMALDQKCERAHYVIENSGSVDDTREQVTRIVAALKCSRHHWRLRIIAGLFCSGVVSFIIWLGTRMYQNRITQ